MIKLKTPRGTTHAKYVELGAFDFDGKWPLKEND